MNGGYVRLSKDDDKRNYSSIENQKLLISQYAASHGFVIHRWYEDDGISGYRFDRPGFQQMMQDLHGDLDLVVVKDLSRLGRHNAKVLLLLDEFQEAGKKLIFVDDHYDDDTIGIKTWFNERYVKDTSRKIKSAIGARQKEGTLQTTPPYGYRRNKTDQKKLEIVPEEAAYIQMIFDLYIKGSGYRRIATQLTEQNIPTPSMTQHQHALENGIVSKRKCTNIWSDSMVKNILENDFYIGTLRLKKRARLTIHGKDKRVPKNEQYHFENHHPAIIENETFSLVQKIKKQRIKNYYRGDRNGHTDPFRGCLFCKDCGHPMTCIHRKSSTKQRTYYICSTYNSKGTRYCSKSHSISQKDLIAAVLAYLKSYRDHFQTALAEGRISPFIPPMEPVCDHRKTVDTLIEQKKNQLKILLSQKLLDLSVSKENEKIINESYESLQKEILNQIQQLEHRRLCSPQKANTPPQNPLAVLDQILENENVTSENIKLFVQRIEVDKNGFTNIYLHYSATDRWYARDDI